MTDAEIEREKRDAEDLAKAVGGVLALLLGLTPSAATVSWDGPRGRFIVDGQVVSIQTVRREMRRFETAVGVRMSRIATDLEKGRLNLDGWRDAMMKLVGSSHVVAAALASGTVSKAVRNTKVQERVAAERKYVTGFAAAIAAKKLARRTIVARAKSYLLAAFITYSIVELAVRKIVGYTEAQRITTARESCEECRAIAYQWIPILEMPSIGSLQCGSRCRCFCEYR